MRRSSGLDQRQRRDQLQMGLLSSLLLLPLLLLNEWVIVACGLRVGSRCERKYLRRGVVHYVTHKLRIAHPGIGGRVSFLSSWT